MIDFKIIKKVGKWAFEITDEGNGRFNIIKFENEVPKDIINVTKEDVESMMSFINTQTKGGSK